MSLRKNVAASLFSQLYVALISIVMVPLYVRYMGPEAYGLVGFFATLQAWFNLLDIGLTPTLARETARQRGGAVDTLSYRRLLRALEGLFLATGVAGAGALLAASASIATDWLQASQLPPDEVLAGVRLMALIIAMRWMAGLYRAAVSGAEQLVWLGGFNAIIATLRFSGVLPLLIYVGASPSLFFGYQLLVAVIELAVLVTYAYRLLPAVPGHTALGWHWAPLKPLLRFSAMIAFTSSVWILVTQTDKLVLSRVLPLADYGYFTLAVLVASAVLVLSAPIGSALMPHLARLEAEERYAQLIVVYRQSTQLVTVVTGAASCALVFGAEAILWAWTGDAQLSQRAAPVLILYAVGNGVLAVSTFPYYLQFAKGDLRLHMIGNAVFVTLLIPLVLWAAIQFGGIGAGYVWLAMNLVAFVFWLPLVHRRFQPGLNYPWYVEDIGVIALAGTAAGYAVSRTFPPAGSRWAQFMAVAVIGISALIAGALASSAIKGKIGMAWRAWSVDKR
jgi:O-antigen/teichoic acid export membrane protein